VEGENNHRRDTRRACTLALAGLIERARDICQFHGRPLELSAQTLDLA
jgi:hypothetical protein